MNYRSAIDLLHLPISVNQTDLLISVIDLSIDKSSDIGKLFTDIGK